MYVLYVVRMYMYAARSFAPEVLRVTPRVHHVTTLSPPCMAESVVRLNTGGFLMVLSEFGVIAVWLMLFAVSSNVYTT